MNKLISWIISLFSRTKEFNLFLDDERNFEDNMNYLVNHHNGFGKLYQSEKWIIVRSSCEFMELIQSRGLPTRISFDHDLGCDSLTGLILLPSGMDCCKWLVEYCLDNDIELTSECRYHTSNPAGKKNMEGLINNFKKNQR
jgi:hypothetical protein